LHPGELSDEGIRISGEITAAKVGRNLHRIGSNEIRNCANVSLPPVV